MSETKFTPGPWKVAPLKGKYYGTVIDLGEVSDVTVWIADYADGVSPRELADGWDADDPYYDHTESAVGYATACLIAAAPELYAALDELTRIIVEHGWDSADAETALAEIDAERVLAKARGEVSS